MRVGFLYFAVLRERLGLDEETLDFADAVPLTVAAAVAELSRRRPAIAPLLPRVQVAVNRTVVAPSHLLADGDELALLPPVAGGHDGPGPARIAVVDAPLSLDAVVAAVTSPDQGGIVTFTGVVRRHGQHPRVVRLEYEAYVAMAEEVLSAIAAEIELAHSGTRVAIHHRIGVLLVGEPAVVIAVSAPHRAEAFAGCRAAIEALKERAPIWKKEIGDDGATWIGLGP